MRIAFAGTPEFAEKQLAALLAAKHDVVVVYTQPDRPAGRGQHLQQSPVKQLAQQHHIPVEQPTTLKTPEAVNTLRQYQPEVMIVAAYGLLLPKAILELPKYGCINVHASILPKYRGAAPIQYAILKGESQTGVTMMQMNEGMDTGDILTLGEIPIENTDTAQSLHDKLAVLGADLLVKTLENIKQIKPTPQDNSKATHAKKINKEQAKIDWSLSATEIDRHIRAYDPWPRAYFTSLDNENVRVWEADLVPLEANAEAGKIVKISPEGMVVATGNHTAIRLKQLQRPGKKPMLVSDILRGNGRLFMVGDVFK